MSDTRSAVAALEASRARLRHVLIPPPEPPGSGAGGGVLRRAGAIWRYWRRRSRNSPVLDLTLDAVQNWWHSHPWRKLGGSLAGPLGEATAPLVRRHPWMAVGLALATGAVIAAARPWRWAMVGRQMYVLRHQAVGWLFAQATNPAAQALLATLVASLVARKPDAEPSDIAAAQAAHAASTSSTTPAAR